MTKKYTYSEKSNGQTLSAEEWNNLAQDVDAAVDAITNILNNSSSSSSSSSSIISAVEDTNAEDPTVNVSIASGVTAIGTPDVIQLTKKKKGVNTTIVSGNNINIEPRESVSDTKGGNISFKPGDDIEIFSHHREDPTEVSMKVLDGSDNPVKLQLNAANIVLTTKDKGKTKEKDGAGNDLSTALYDDPNVMNITVNSAKNTRGYLKVRAQAIDLRCEDHGGVALQPNGVDSDGHMNKIKFEHGGGDGLEFGTFNAEHTSLFTDDYRFNKDGEIKLATRKKVYSDKAVKFTCTGVQTSSNDNADTYSETQNVSSITAPQDIATGTNYKYSIFEIAEMFSGLDIEKFQAWLETKSSNDIEIKCTGNMYFQFTEIDTFTNTTSNYKYLKNSEDDFYDFVDDNYSCTWKDVVKTAETFGDMISGRYKVKTYTSGNIVHTFDFSNENVANPFESVKAYTFSELLDVLLLFVDDHSQMSILFANIQNSITHGDWICIELYNDETVYLQYTESQNVFSYRKNSYFEDANTSENIRISDMISILNELKDMKDNNQGPWAGL